MGLISDFDKSTGEEEGVIIKAPFGYAGGKSKSVKQIVPHLPVRNAYIEPFGGSAAVLLGRRPSKLEVYNDAYGGVVDFYRCILDPILLKKLMERLEFALHSREQFVEYRANWHLQSDPVERAARWYAMNQYSFGNKRDCWGRALRTGIAGKLQRQLPGFWSVHERMKNVTVENGDAFVCMQAYDHPEAVIYLDPPYLDANCSIYEFEPDQKYHHNMLKWIHEESVGFFAVSGYANNLYDSFPWDKRITWKVFVSLESLGTANNRNNKANLNPQRHHVEEVLWIKEAHR